MNAHSPQRPAAEPIWLVGEWVEGDPRYRALAAFATRDEAVAEAALHPGAMILFRPAPKPAPPPPLRPRRRLGRPPSSNSHPTPRPAPPASTRKNQMIDTDDLTAPQLDEERAAEVALELAETTKSRSPTSSR